MTTSVRFRLVADIPNWRPKSSQHSQNARLEHFAKASRNKTARKYVGDALMIAGWPRELPAGRKFTVTFRVEQRLGSFPDSDNLIASLKSCRDAVAAWLGTTDSTRGPITWRYRSCRGPGDRVVMVLEEVV